jgi:two-component sensor histidine kinase
MGNAVQCDGVREFPPVSESGDSALEALCELLMRGALPPGLPSEVIENKHFCELASTLASLQKFVLAISSGDLTPTLKAKGLTAGSLKNLQASLRHLTWQTQMIAQGNLSHRAEFMEDFSKAFNSVVTHLEEAQEKLRRNQSEISRANEILLQECQARRKLHEQAELEARSKLELMKEIDHRVKNNLMVIQALLLTEGRHAPAESRAHVERMIGRLTGRIDGLFNAHRMLSESRWAPMRVSDLAEQVIRGVLKGLPSGRSVELVVESSPVEVSPRQAGHLALVFTELASNTIVHGVPLGNTGRIGVRTDWGEGMIVIEYRDDGPGYPPEVLRFEGIKTGLVLLRDWVANTLQGSLNLFSDNGAVAVMSIRAEERHKT